MKISLNTNNFNRSVSPNFQRKRATQKTSSDSFPVLDKLQPTFVHISGLVFDCYENSVPSGMFKSPLAYPETQRLEDNLSKLYAATEKTGVGKISTPLLSSKSVSITPRAKEAFRQRLLSTSWRGDNKIENEAFLSDFCQESIKKTIQNFETFSTTKNWCMNVDMAEGGLFKYTFSKMGVNSITSFSILGTDEVLTRGFQDENCDAHTDFDGAGVYDYNHGCALFQAINRYPKLIRILQKDLLKFHDIV